VKEEKENIYHLQLNDGRISAQLLINLIKADIYLGFPLFSASVS